MIRLVIKFKFIIIIVYLGLSLTDLYLKMRMKSFKQRVLKQKQQANIYMQQSNTYMQQANTYMQKGKVLGESMSLRNLEQRFKSKTVVNKQNQQPNMGLKTQRLVVENSFGAAKLTMRQSVDQLRLHLHNGCSQRPYQGLNPSKPSYAKFNFLSKSNNFQEYKGQGNLHGNAFSKKRLKTQEQHFDGQGYTENPTIEACQLIKSQYESSGDQLRQQEKLYYAKSYMGPQQRQNCKNARNILIHESLDYDQDRAREVLGFEPAEAENIRRYHFQREQEKMMKSQILNNIIMNSKADMMKSCDLDQSSTVTCVNHMNKKAKYKLNAALTQEQQENFYCSKCAVNLAKQGFDIQQISDVERRMLFTRSLQGGLVQGGLQIKRQTNTREERYVGFEKRVQSLKAKISCKLKLFSRKSDSMTKMDNLIQLTINNYDQLIQILNQMKRQQLEKQQKIKNKKSQYINLKKHELTTILDNIKDTAFQINNQKNKLMASKNREFTFIFDSYVNKISSYEDYLNNLEQTQLANEIATFDDNMASEQLDQQTIIHQIFEEMYKKLTNPKLQALINSSKQTFPPGKTLGATTSRKQRNSQQAQNSMLYCQEEDQEQTRPPFRILFQNSKSEQMCTQQKDINMQYVNMNNSTKMNPSLQNHPHHNIRYFKQQNYQPNHHY